MKRIGTIELEGMEFWANHGCLEREKAAGNLFVVDFKGKAELWDAAESDELSKAVDYSRIYDIVAREIMVRSDLLENVCGRIVKALEKEVPELIGFEVRVSKQRPPVDGVCAWSRITMEK